jgi:CubicO group peptidase (beta-lactamase class C family)
MRRPVLNMASTTGETVPRAVAAGQVPGLSIAVVDAAGMLLDTGFGHADIADGIPATAATRYRWFSMTKLVTATAAVQLSDQGKLDLTSQVRTHLDSWPAGHAATVGQLLSHTAGLPNPLPVKWVHPVGAAHPDQTAMLDRLLHRHGAATRPPGGPARYSNIGYLAAAEIIARTTGTSFQQHITNALLIPLGMTATGFQHPDSDAATGYLNLPRPIVPLLNGLLPAELIGDRHKGVRALRPFLVDGAGYGGLIGPASDAARFLRLHLRDGELDDVRILTPGSARQMRTLVSRGRSFDHATGWFRDRTRRAEIGCHWEHYGTGAGYWNIARIYPDLGLGVVIMTNSTRRFDFPSIMTTITKNHRPS